MRNGDDAEYIRLENRPNPIERRDARAARFHDLLERPSRFSRMRDARIVHEHVETAELIPNAFCRGRDRGLICDVELKGVGIRSDALRRRFPMGKVARPDEHGEAVRRKVLRDLKTDPLVGPGNQGNWFVLHSNLLLGVDRWPPSPCCTTEKADRSSNRIAPGE